MQLKLYFHPETKLLIHTSARSEKNLKYLEEVGAFHVGDVKGRDVGFPKNQWNDAGFLKKYLRHHH